MIMAVAAFTPALKQMLIDGIVSSPAVPRWLRISPVGIFFLWLAAVLTVMGVGFLLFAEYMYLAETYSSVVASLGVACTAIAVSWLSAATGMMINDRRASKQTIHSFRQQPDITKTVTALIDSVAEELEEPIRENPKTALMIASLAGFLAGDKGRGLQLDTMR